MIMALCIVAFLAALVIGGLTLLHTSLRTVPYRDIAEEWTIFLCAWTALLTPFGAALAWYYGV